jgi:hypothetical protein
VGEGAAPLMGIFLPRQSILAPIGLVTQPNQYAQYPSGACKVARNFVLRNPGELVQAPDVQDVRFFTAPNDVIHKLMPLDNGHVYEFHQNGTTWTVYEQNGVTGWNVPFVPLFSSATNAFSSTGRISWTRVAERLITNPTFGNVVGDYTAPTSLAEVALRVAGMPQPSLSGLALVNSGSGWIAGGQMVAYTACLVREFADGYKIRSSPAAPTKMLPTFPGPYNVNVSLRFWTDNTIVAGDKIEIYRTDAVATTSMSVDPGSTFKLVFTHTITSGEASSGSVTVKDSQPNISGSLVAPGRELYTNPGQEGEDYANRRPPIAKCVESFKGFAFYGHTTERAQFVFSVPGGLGDENEAVATGVSVSVFKENGIGVRRGAGTITNGSAVITGVSAANLVGVKAGQQWAGGTGFSGTPTVLSVGASSITMSANANAGAAAWQLVDVLELDGTTYPVFNGVNLISRIQGRFEITCTITIPSGPPDFMLAFEFTLERNFYPLQTAVTVRGTNGANYSPPIPEIGVTARSLSALTRKNRIQWSKEQQPEHAPSVSETFAGFGELYAMNATRDAMWLWCSDGLFRMSGHAGALGLGAWQVDYANSTLILAGPQASCALNEFLYGYTNIGFVEVDSAGNVINLTDKLIGDLLPGQKYVESRSIVVERNETDEEILLILGDNGAGSSNTVYVFNTKQRGWTTLGGNGTNLSTLTALAMQRSPSSGEPRTLLASSPLGGQDARYSSWNHASAFLAAEARYQPIYGDDPLEVKRWLWADYLFDSGSNGRSITPTWNGTQYGTSFALQTLDTNGAYGRAGCPREVGSSSSISPGLLLAAGATQSRLQGISVPLKQRTNQSKKR